MIHTFTIQAGDTAEFYSPGDFFRLLDCPDVLDVIFYRNGAEVSRADDVQEGYAEKFEAGGYDRFRITSATTQTVHFVSRQGNVVFYDKPPTGDVNVLNLPANRGAFTHTGHTVTNTADVQLLPANPNRRYLLIQNKDPSGSIWIRLDGGVVTGSNAAIRIDVGGSYELQGYVPTGIVMAVGNIASNTNVATVEG